jgi:hypothetical protein
LFEAVPQQQRRQQQEQADRTTAGDTILRGHSSCSGRTQPAGVASCKASGRSVGGGPVHSLVDLRADTELLALVDIPDAIWDDAATLSLVDAVAIDAMYDWGTLLRKVRAQDLYIQFAGSYFLEVISSVSARARQRNGLACFERAMHTCCKHLLTSLLPALRCCCCSVPGTVALRFLEAGPHGCGHRGSLYPIADSRRGCLASAAESLCDGPRVGCNVAER